MERTAKCLTSLTANTPGVRLIFSATNQAADLTSRNQGFFAGCPGNSAGDLFGMLETYPPLKLVAGDHPSTSRIRRIRSRLKKSPG